MSGIGTGVSLEDATLLCRLSYLKSLMHMQYDLSVSTFSPDGRVFQTDYAQKAVDNSG